MTRTIAIGIILATSALVVAVLLVVLALITRDGGPADGWEAGGLDELHDLRDEENGGWLDDTAAVAAWGTIVDRVLDEWDEFEVPQLDPVTARPYVPYMGRHAEDTIEFHLVPAGWQPAIGAARIAAALDATEQIEAVTT